MADYKKLTLNQAIYEPYAVDGAFDSLIPELDLAMGVWWSHTVNAPAITLSKICRIIDRYGPLPPVPSTDQELKIAKAIMKSLANSNFGRWNDEVKNGRWQRTRTHAMKLWPKSLFKSDGIMPKKVQG